MAALKSTPGYAETQIRLLLSDLNSSTHNVRLKAITKFQEYIKANKPDVFDDDVDMLYQGLRVNNTIKGLGLLQISGLDSENHAGQLKRIAAPAIALLRWLITCPEYGNDNIFYDRFVQLSEEEYKKMNLAKHINQDVKSSLNNARLGSSADAFLILSVLVRDHRNPETGEIDVINISSIISDKVAKDKFTAWYNKATSQPLEETTKTLKRKAAKANRPTTWEDLHFRPVPLQEGEDSWNVEEETKVSDHLIVPDPLGLKDYDLVERQEAYSLGRISVGGHNAGKRSPKRLNETLYGVKTYESDSDDDAADNEFEDASSDSDEELEPNPPPNETATSKSPSTRKSTMTMKKNVRKAKKPKFSVIPSDKNFSIGIFLRLIHGDVGFEDFRQGLHNLENKLNHQSNLRENIVRTNFGMFIECTEGLAWLKEFKRGTAKLPEGKFSPRSSTALTANQRKKAFDIIVHKCETGETKLIRGSKYLAIAKHEAEKTLTPILDRMRQSRKIKSADKVLKRLSSTLEYPHRMQRALDKEDYIEVINIYQRIQAIPSTSSLRVLQRVRESAENIIKNAKNKCIVTLQTPTIDPNVLIQHAKILRDLEGDESYRENLKLSFAKQAHTVTDSLQSIYDRFIEDAKIAFNQGQEYHSSRRYETSSERKTSQVVDGSSNVLSPLEVEREIVQDLKRRLYKTLRAAKISSNKSKKRRIDKYSKDIDETGLNITDQEANENEADFMIVFDRDLIPSSEGLDTDAFHIDEDDIDRMDIRSLLSVKVRLQFIHNVIDCLVQWTPCLNRLVAEIISSNVTSTAQSTIRSLNRNVSQVSVKLFSIILTTFSESIHQAVYGFVVKSGNTIRELIASIRSNNSLLPTVVESNKSLINIRKRGSFVDLNELQKPIISDETSRHSDSNDDQTILRTSFYTSRLPDFGYLNVMKELCDVYDTIDALLSSTLTAINDPISMQNESMIGSSLNGSKQGVSTKGTVSIVSPETRLSKNSPYYDALGPLRETAKEGESLISHRIIDRLLEIVIVTHSTYNHSTTEDSLSNHHSAKNKLPFNPKNGKREIYTPQRLETAMKRFNAIVDDGFHQIIQLIHRPDWVCQIVLEGFQRAISSVIEILRREFQCMGEEYLQASNPRLQRTSTLTHMNRPRSGEDLLRQSSQALNSLGSFNQLSGRRRTSTLRELVQDTSTTSNLETLEEELRINCAPEAEKSIILIDILRSLILLRTDIVPSAWIYLTKTFINPLISYGNSYNKDNQISIESVGKGLDTGKDTILSRLMNITGNKAPNRPESLCNRILDAVAQSVDPDSSNYMVNILTDAAKFEETIVNGLINMKTSSIRVSITTYYSVIIKKELNQLKTPMSVPAVPSGNRELPTHLSKVLLVLGFEKLHFENCLPDYLITTGITTRISPSQPNQMNNGNDEDSESDYSASENGDLYYDDPDDGSNDSDDDTIGSRTGTVPNTSKSSTLGSTNTNLYVNYLYKELCFRSLNIYIDLIKKINDNGFVGNKLRFGANNPSSGNLVAYSSTIQCPKALGQAIEEIEYLKSVLKILFPNDNQSSIVSMMNSLNIPTSVRNNAGKDFLSAEQLLSMSQVYHMTIRR